MMLGKIREVNPANVASVSGRWRRGGGRGILGKSLRRSSGDDCSEDGVDLP